MINVYYYIIVVPGYKDSHKQMVAAAVEQQTASSSSKKQKLATVTCRFLDAPFLHGLYAHASITISIPECIYRHNNRPF